MNQNELFYWAYENYRKEFLDNRDDYLFKKGVNSKKAPEDYVSMIEISCEIDEDWIAAIEKGLHYIAKAIKEDRQFIRNEGEVLPIEKIRRVSKDSISDLSKHSNYITHLPENEDDPVVPEKLLMIKRENDYSIYENRVVYTTLSYLKDFVATRLERIKELVNKYDGKLQIKKKIELGYRTVDVLLQIHDVRKSDERAIKRNNCQEKIDRLDAILNGVLILLKTPLMQEVSKAPLVNRPVTKTNVLKMNTNFKESLYIFDYVCAYNEPGFKITEQEVKIAPLSIDQENTFTDIILLSSFLGYRYNNNMEIELDKAYKDEEKARQKIVDDKVLKRIQELMDKARKSEKEIGEYLYVLEEGHRALEKRIEDAKLEMENLVKEHEEEIIKLNEAHQKELDKQQEYFDEELRDINESHIQEIESIKIQYSEEIDALNTKHAEEIASIRESIKKEYEDTIQEKDGRIENLSKSNSDLSTEFNNYKNEASSVKTELENCIKELEKELELVKAENLALKVEKGKKFVDPKDYASKERYKEIERAIEVLTIFCDETWKEAKKDIKKKYYADIKSKGGK